MDREGEDLKWLVTEFAKSVQRIEELEAALRWYADVCYSDLKMSQHLMGPSGDYGDIARAALGEKKDGNV